MSETAASGEAGGEAGAKAGGEAGTKPGTKPGAKSGGKGEAAPPAPAQSVIPKVDTSGFTGMVLTTVIVAVGCAEAKRVVDMKWNATHNKASEKRVIKEPLSPVFGGFIMGIFLFAFGMVNEYLANLFCILIIVGSLLINGLSVFELLH